MKIRISSLNSNLRLGASGHARLLHFKMSRHSTRSPSVASTILDSPLSDKSGHKRPAEEVGSGYLMKEPKRSKTAEAAGTEDLVDSFENVGFDFPQTPPEEWYKLNGCDDQEVTPEIIEAEDSHCRHRNLKVSDMQMVRREIKYVNSSGVHASAYWRSTLASNRLTAKALLHELPDEIRAEAAARLSEVAGCSDVIFMQPHQSPSDVIQHAITDRKPFYIGISERPASRMADHRSNGFSAMCLWGFESSHWTASREKSLIGQYRNCGLLLNVGSGGERASMGRPHFLYVVIQKHPSQLLRRN